MNFYLYCLLTHDHCQFSIRNSQVEIVKNIFISLLPGKGSISEFENVCSFEGGAFINFLLLFFIILPDKALILISLCARVKRYVGAQGLLLIKKGLDPIAADKALNEDGDGDWKHGETNRQLVKQSQCCEQLTRWEHFWFYSSVNP